MGLFVFVKSRAVGRWINGWLIIIVVVKDAYYSKINWLCFISNDSMLLLYLKKKNNNNNNNNNEYI